MGFWGIILNPFFSNVDIFKMSTFIHNNDNTYYSTFACKVEKFIEKNSLCTKFSFLEYSYFR